MHPFYYLNRIIYTIIIFLFGREISSLETIYNFSYLNCINFTIIVLNVWKKNDKI